MFREDKTTQMAAKFLKLAGGTLPYIKLLKMLYLADKEMLVRHGKPITYDRWHALKYGPVLSATYNIIKGTAQPAYWSKFIQTCNYEVVLTEDPGLDDLSRAETRIIEEIFNKYKDHNEWAMAPVTHELPEWEDPGDTSREITPKEVLQVEGFSDDDIAGILDNISLQDDAQRFQVSG